MLSITIFVLLTF